MTHRLQISDGIKLRHTILEGENEPIDDIPSF